MGQREDLVPIRSTVTRTNVGQTGVRVLGLTYNLVGVRQRFTGAPAAELPPEVPAGQRTVAEARYYNEAGPAEVILRSGILFEGATPLPGNRSDLNPGEAVSRDLIFYADRTRFDSIRFLVGLSYSKLSEPPIPLVLEVAGDGRIAAVPGPGCGAEPLRCKGLATTDFGTEFSLW